MKDKGTFNYFVSVFFSIENRIHPFGHGELREQLENMEKLEE